MALSLAFASPNVTPLEEFHRLIRYIRVLNWHLLTDYLLNEDYWHFLIPYALQSLTVR